MKKLISYCLFAVGFLLVFMIPEDSSTSWVEDILMSKCIAVALFILAGWIEKGFYNTTQEDDV